MPYGFRTTEGPVQPNFDSFNSNISQNLTRIFAQKLMKHGLKKEEIQDLVDRAVKKKEGAK